MPINHLKGDGMAKLKRRMLALAGVGAMVTGAGLVMANASLAAAGHSGTKASSGPIDGALYKATPFSGDNFEMRVSKSGSSAAFVGTFVYSDPGCPTAPSGNEYLTSKTAPAVSIESNGKFSGTKKNGAYRDTISGTFNHTSAPTTFQETIPGCKGDKPDTYRFTMTIVKKAKKKPPTISGISPKEGPAPGGTPVTITGANLSGATAVHFGKSGAKIDKSISATEIKVTSPAGSGTVDVTVTTPRGTSAKTSADRYTYLGRPTVTRLAPNNGVPGGGTVVTITGENLSDATAVHFGTAVAKINKIVSNTEIKVTAPKGPGLGVKVDVTVTTPSGTSAKTSADRYLYTYC